MGRLRLTSAKTPTFNPLHTAAAVASALEIPSPPGMDCTSQAPTPDHPGKGLAAHPHHRPEVHRSAQADLT